MRLKVILMFLHLSQETLGAILFDGYEGKVLSESEDGNWVEAKSKCKYRKKRIDSKQTTCDIFR